MKYVFAFMCLVFTVFCAYAGIISTNPVCTVIDFICCTLNFGCCLFHLLN
jgi:hypothetical protein